MHIKIAYLITLLFGITFGVAAVAVETKQITVNGTPFTYVEQGKGIRDCSGARRHGRLSHLDW